MLEYYPHVAIKYVQKYGKYRTPSWRNETRARRQGIPPAAFQFAERRMQGEYDYEDAEIIDEWLAEDPHRTNSTHFSKPFFREEGSSIFRNVIWPPQDRHDRSLPIPVPSVSTETYCQFAWDKKVDTDLFTHSIMYRRNLAIAAGYVRQAAMKRRQEDEGKREEARLEEMLLMEEAELSAEEQQPSVAVQIRDAEAATEMECTERYRELFDLPLSREDRLRLDWTADEDRELLAWVDDLGERDWLRISHFVRHHQETCKFRYKQLKGDDFNTEIEDANEADIRPARQLPAYKGPLVSPAGQDNTNGASQRGEAQGSDASSDTSRSWSEPPKRKTPPLDEDYDDSSEIDDQEGSKASSPKKRARHIH